MISLHCGNDGVSVCANGVQSVTSMASSQKYVRTLSQNAQKSGLFDAFSEKAAIFKGLQIRHNKYYADISKRLITKSIVCLFYHVLFLSCQVLALDTTSSGHDIIPHGGDAADQKDAPDVTGPLDVALVHHA